MTTDTAEQVEKKVRRPRASLIGLRITLVLHAALVVAQPILAGYFLSGNVDAITIHGSIGSTVWMVAMIQFVVAAIYWLVGGGRVWPTVPHRRPVRRRVRPARPSATSRTSPSTSHSGPRS